LSLASLPTRSAASPSTTEPRAKSVLFVFLFGAPSPLDTFDPKPDAPAEIRGEFKTISTCVPGIIVSEHLPRIAQRMNQLCVVRSMSMDPSLGAHDFGCHSILSGIDLPPVGPTRASSRLAWPCYAAGIDAAVGKRPGLPTGVHLPLPIMDATIGRYPGQDAGLLGPTHDPLQLLQDPNEPTFEVSQYQLPKALSASQLNDRVALLRDINAQQEALGRQADLLDMSRQQREAADFLAQGRLARAFDLAREPDRVRDRYGRHLYGQSLLLARRLVAEGVPIVQASLSVGQAQWDTHTDNFQSLRTVLLPPFDQALSALLDDLDATGLLRETLVVIMGEFGRTPKIGGNLGTPFYSPTGRDHWTACFFACFAGAGVKGGSLVGASDRIGAYPVTAAYSPADLGATLYEALGVDPQTIVADSLGRPVRLNTGKPMLALYNT
jgi:hypothetical protein